MQFPSPAASSRPDFDPARSELGAREALWFRAGHEHCFGMLHRPKGTPTRAVVLCNSIGFEGQTAFRTLLQLADTLADQGCAVLRFDYPGAGDSEGDLTSTGDLRRALTGLDSAVSVLRQKTGIESVDLIGLRVGANLALQYATTHPGVASITLWAPCRNGRILVKELRTLAKVAASRRRGQGKPEATGGADILDVAGFGITPENLAQLAAIYGDRDLAVAPAPAVLVIDRAEVGPSSSLVTRLGELGATVTHHLTSDWTRFMVGEEALSERPIESLAVITDWIDRLPRHESIGANRPKTVAATRSMVFPGPIDDLDPGAAGEFRNIVEEPLWLDGGLFAIRTQPEPDRGLNDHDRPAIVLLNTGGTSRTGPGRLYVALARHWAARGVTAVRVDLGGTGDARTADVQPYDPYVPERTAEVESIVHWVRENLRPTELVLFGVCSGSYHAFHSALRQAPVDRVLLANPTKFYVDGPVSAEDGTHAVYGLRHPFRHRGRIFRSLRFRSIGSSFQELFKGLASVTTNKVRSTIVRLGLSAPSRTQIANDLLTLKSLGVRVHMIFTPGEASGRYVRDFGGATLAALEESGDISITTLSSGDHVFAPLAARRELAGATDPTDLLLGNVQLSAAFG